MQVNLYNQDAKSIGKVDLPDQIFSLDVNNDLLHQVVISQISNKRQVIAHAKTRAEVRGGGKKPWKQKGTGRARHGSIRSPIWKGGGVAFGPTKDRNFKKKINRKMAKKALYMALSSKVNDKELIVIDDIKLNEWKTKEMARVINNTSKLFPENKKGKTLIVISKNANKDLKRVSKNIPDLYLIEALNLSAHDIISRKNTLFLNSSVEALRVSTTPKK
jgi:large subunit ribosomal protein L4